VLEQRFTRYDLQQGPGQDAVPRDDEEIAQLDSRGPDDDLPAGDGIGRDTALEQVAGRETGDGAGIDGIVDDQPALAAGRQIAEGGGERGHPAARQPHAQRVGTDQPVRIEADIDRDGIGMLGEAGQGQVDRRRRAANRLLLEGGKQRIAAGIGKRTLEAGVVDRIGGDRKIDVEGDRVGA
jgi:hypothetical protein